VGCVMGAKNLKAIALKGTGFPDAGNDPELWSLMADSRSYFKGLSKGRVLSYLFKNRGTAFLLESKSKKGGMAVKNFREGTFPQVDRINAKEAGKRLWVRDYACYCCPLACKKSGMVKTGPYRGQLVHDGPEYETGTMLGANLMIADLEGIMKLVYDGDNLGLDIISAGNIIGFLMEAYERGHIDRDFLDGIDLIWGSVEGAAAILDKMVRRQGVGELAARGVKALSEEIGGDSNDFAMHVKGMEIAAHNVQADPLKGLCYATCNRGGCHQNGDSIREQDLRAVIDSLGICRFAALTPLGLSVDRLARLVSAVTGIRRTGDDLLKAGERIFNLEKVFNLREGFTREDDALPERFFTDAFTLGPKKGAVLRKKDFNQRLSQYYRERGWDPDSTVPSVKKLAELGLSFTL
ncbi:MAG: hypothetical protein MI863_10125, partial [Desulfobacterales bacterium]|nr:hypothetical protein [Desulfobacterales bacterium]